MDKRVSFSSLSDMHGMPLGRRAALVGVAALMCAALVATWLVVSRDAVSLVSDPERLAQIQADLSAASSDLDALTNPVGTESGPAEVTGCSTDSSVEVYEPALFREWTFTGDESSDVLKVTEAGKRAGEAIAAALKSRGWSGSQRVAGSPFPSTVLRKSFDDFRVTLAIQVDGEGVLAGGSLVDQEPVCAPSE